MKASSLFKPAAYGERYRAVRRLARRMPTAVRSRRRWLLRRLLQPQLQLPVWIDCGPVGRFFLGPDPADDRLLEHFLGAWWPVYFPDVELADRVLLLDLGAHHGVFTVAALHRWPGSRAIAVEPDPKAVALLRKNLRGNGIDARVRVVAKAAAQRSGHARLLTVAGDSCAHFLAETDSPSSLPNARAAAEVRTVPAATIAEILDGERPSFVKCNAEGAEYVVLPALLELHTPPVMVIEVHADLGDPAPLLAELTRRGYRLEQVGVELGLAGWWHASLPQAGAQARRS